MCRRRFNPHNYSGKWTKDEEEALVKLVGARGYAWKEITEEFNSEFENKRTSGNIKDKWKQIGSENASTRVKGPWSLSEAITMFKTVCEAIGASEILRKSTKVVFLPGEGTKRFEKVGKEIRIYDADRVQVSEIIPLIVRKELAKDHFRSIDLVVSWKTIAENL